MPNFVTVFEITRGSNGVLSDTLFRLLIGLGVLVVGLTHLVFVWRSNGAWSKKDWVTFLFLIAWSVVWLVGHNFPHTFGSINNLAQAYEKGQYQVVEGEVSVLHRQPVTGHSRGDLIVINGTQFEVNYFLATSAYRNTITHGGVLRGGTYARVYHLDGQILRIDIRQP